MFPRDALSADVAKGAERLVERGAGRDSRWSSSSQHHHQQQRRAAHTIALVLAARHRLRTLLEVRPSVSASECEGWRRWWCTDGVGGAGDGGDGALGTAVPLCWWCLV
jgi:hypothetical protein